MKFRINPEVTDQLDLPCRLAAHEPDTIRLPDKPYCLFRSGTPVDHKLFGKYQANLRKHLMHTVTVVIILRKILRVGTDKYYQIPLGQVFPQNRCKSIVKMMLRETAEQPEKTRIPTHICVHFRTP